MPRCFRNRESPNGLRCAPWLLLAHFTCALTSCSLLLDFSGPISSSQNDAGFDASPTADAKDNKVADATPDAMPLAGCDVYPGFNSFDNPADITPTSGFAQFTGALCKPGEVDFFSFEIQANRDVAIDIRAEHVFEAILYEGSDVDVAQKGIAQPTASGFGMEVRFGPTTQNPLPATTPELPHIIELRSPDGLAFSYDFTISIEQ